MRARSLAPIALALTFGSFVPDAVACYGAPLRLVGGAPHSVPPAPPFAEGDNMRFALSAFGASIAASSSVALPTGSAVSFSYALSPRVDASATAKDLTAYVPGGFTGALHDFKTYLELWQGAPYASQSGPLATADLSGSASGAVSFSVPSAGEYSVIAVMTYTASGPSVSAAAACSYMGIDSGYCVPAPPLADFNAYLSTPADEFCSPSGVLPPLGLGVLTFSVTAKPRAASSVLFLPGTEASRLYYRGIGGIEHQVWEPDFYTDLPYLALEADGTSKKTLYTKDIIGTLEAHNLFESAIAGLFGDNLEVYRSFKRFMNGLVANGTIQEWRAYPYDWRYSVDDIVRQGTLTEMPDGSVKRIYLKDVLMQMASSSPTGKVTIIGHSNGGLLAKALASALGADASNYIDRIVMLGTPQFGTPSDIGVLLHGDGQTEGFGLVMNRAEARSVVQTMPDAYDLLPSPAYFSRVASPAVAFDTAGSLSGKYAAYFGSSITSFSALAGFLEDAAGLDAQAGSASDLRTPLALSSSLVAKAQATHALLDAWTPPPGIAVTAIAGWGQETTGGLAYSTGERTVCRQAAVAGPSVCAETPYLEHAPILTQDGDNTVVSPSAVGNTGDGLYFDSFLFGKNNKRQIVHQDLTSATPIQNQIVNLLTGNARPLVSYLSDTQPTGGGNPLIQISSHSPVNLIVTDAGGKQSGVLPMPGTDFAGVKQDILGSSVQALDDEEYVTLPQGGSYQVEAHGYAAGPATITMATVRSDGTASTTVSAPDLPVTASTTISFAMASGTPGSVSVDENGDGTPDFTVSAGALGSDPLAFVRYVESAVEAMALRAVPKREVLAQLALVERSLQRAGRLKNLQARYPQFFSQHDPLAALQIAALERYVKLQAALPLQAWPQALGGRPHRDFPLGISATDAETLLDLLARLKTLAV